MKILAFESSAVSASVALIEEERLVAQSFQNCGLTHSRTLLPMAEDLLANCGVSLDEIDAIAVAHGPGSFTGAEKSPAAAAAGLLLCVNAGLVRCDRAGDIGLYLLERDAEGDRQLAVQQIFRALAVALVDLADAPEYSPIPPRRKARRKHRSEPWGGPCTARGWYPPPPC